MVPSHLSLCGTLSLPHLPAAAMCFEPWPAHLPQGRPDGCFHPGELRHPTPASGSHVSCPPRSPGTPGGLCLGKLRSIPAGWSGVRVTRCGRLAGAAGCPPTSPPGTVPPACGTPRELEQLRQHPQGREMWCWSSRGPTGSWVASHRQEQREDAGPSCLEERGTAHTSAVCKGVEMSAASLGGLELLGLFASGWARR